MGRGNELCESAVGQKGNIKDCISLTSSRPHNFSYFSISEVQI